jgi:hypothetical protein
MFASHAHTPARLRLKRKSSWNHNWVVDFHTKITSQLLPHAPSHESAALS